MEGWRSDRMMTERERIRARAARLEGQGRFASWFAERPPRSGKGGRRVAVTYHADGTKTEHYEGALKPIRKWRGEA